jgi:hypothetical protein
VSDADDDELLALEQQLEARALVRDAQIEALQAAHDAVSHTEVIDLETMLQRYAWVLTQAVVVDLHEPTLTYSVQEFRVTTRGSFRTIIGPRGGERHALIADDWLEHPGRIDVYGFDFLPGAPRHTTNAAGKPVVNQWRPPEILKTALPPDWTQRAAVLAEHLGNLIPDPEQRLNVLRWLAYRVQSPGKLPGWHLLLIAESVQGTGRNWLARMMKALLGPSVLESVPLKRILAGGFNGEIDRRVLGVVDEIREGGRDYWEHAEALKSFLTEKVRVINEKYKVPYEVQNFFGVMMFSNHLAAIPLDKTDRRIYVVECTRTLQDKAYFDRIYDALADKSTLRALYQALLAVPLDDFQIEGRAPDTAMKLALVKSNTTTYEALLAEFAEEWPSDVIRLARLESEMHAKIQRDYPSMDTPRGFVPTGAARNNVYARLGMKGDLRPRMDVKGLDGKVTSGKTSVVVLRRWHEHWKAIAERRELQLLAAEAERGERDASSR